MPMGDHRYLVVVALGNETPDLSSLRAFIVEGPNGITYHPGVWHHPVFCLSRPQDFLVVDRGGLSDDLLEVDVSTDEIGVHCPVAEGRD